MHAQANLHGELVLQLAIGLGNYVNSDIDIFNGVILDIGSRTIILTKLHTFAH